MNFSGLTEEEIVEQQRFTDELYNNHRVSLEDYLNTLIDQKGSCGLCMKSESEFEGSFEVHKKEENAETFILTCKECCTMLNWTRDNQNSFKRLYQMYAPKKEPVKKSKPLPLNSQFPSELGF